MSAEEVARAHYEARHRLTSAVSDLAAQSWAQVDPVNLTTSWSRALPQMAVGIAGAQLAAARMADGYVADALDEQGLAPDASAAVVPDALAGVASDGRPLASLLLNPIFATMTAIGSGAPIDRAMASGFANLDMIARTQVADAGRAADHASLVAHSGATGYTRHLSPPSCSRCVLLAGRFYRWNAGFKRHPACDCIHTPGTGDDSLETNPRAYFDSLSAAEQDKAFTKAGAAAIREGADIGRVVNADRGMYTAAGKHFTTEATTRAGVGRRVRLMPDQIYAEAKGDRAEALRLLERHGYIRPTARRIPRPPVLEPVPIPRPLPTRGALQQSVASGVKSREKLSGGLVADTSLVTFNDGSKAVLKVSKPIGKRLTAQQQQDAEELAPLVLNALGLRAPNTYRAGPDELYMEFMPGKLAERVPIGRDYLPEPTYRDEDQFRLLGLADQVIYNGDRHKANWLIDDDGSIYGIDHGLAFVTSSFTAPAHGVPIVTRFKEPLWQFAREVNGVGEWIDTDMSPADMALARSRIEALRPEFERLGRRDWLDGGLARLDAMAGHAKGTKRRIQ